MRFSQNFILRKSTSFSVAWRGPSIVFICIVTETFSMPLLYEFDMSKSTTSRHNIIVQNTRSVRESDNSILQNFSENKTVLIVGDILIPAGILARTSLILCRIIFSRSYLSIRLRTNKTRQLHVLYVFRLLDLFRSCKDIMSRYTYPLFCSLLNI